MALPDAAITVFQFHPHSVAVFQRSADGGEAEGDRLTLTLSDIGEASLHTGHPDSSTYAILPRHDATVRIFTLPSVDKSEIESMVRLGAAEMVPDPIEEMVVTHQTLAQLPSGESRVLVILVRQATINALLDNLAEQGQEPLQLFLSTACLVAAANAMEGVSEIALLHIDPAALELVVLQEGELCFSRGVAHDGPWDLTDPHGREALAYEIKDALAAYRRERDDGVGVESVHVSAVGLPVEDVTALAAEASEKACCAAETSLRLDSGATPCPANFDGAVRLARGEGPLVLSLTPPRLASQRALNNLKVHILHGAALAGIVLLALLLWFGQAVWQRSALIAELQTRIDAIAPSAQGVAAKQHGLQIISRQVYRGGSFLLLAGVAAAAPPSGLNITRIQYDRESGLNVWGRAESKDLVLKDFLGAMRQRAEGNLAPFAGAHSLYETVGAERGQQIINYQIAIPVVEEAAHGDDPSHR